MNAIARSLDVAGSALYFAIVYAYLHKRRGLHLRPVHAEGNLVITVAFARDHLGQVIEDSLVQALHDGQSVRGRKIDASFPLPSAAFIAACA
jgi:hypothetical protein